MQLDENEEKLLRSVALQNAREVLHAREKAERELVQTKEALEQKTEELSEQREWFAVTLSSIGDAVITTDLEGKVTFLNPVAEIMTGWKSTEAIGHPLENVFNIVSEQSRKRVENPIAKVLRDGGVVGLANHTLLIAKDGKETAIEDSAAPIKDAFGRISGAVMVFHDVTNRRRTEAALRESNERTSNILESITDAFYVLDQEWRFTFLNKRAEEILRPLKRSCENLLGKNIWQEFSDLVGTVAEKSFRRAVAEQMTVEFELFYPPVNAWFEIRAYPLRDGLSVYLQNITERKQTAESLRESADRLRAVFNQAAVGIAMAAMDGRFIETNQKFSDILGYSREELRELTFTDITHPDDLDSTQAHVHRLIAGEIADFVYEKRYLRKDGRVIWSLTTVTLLKDADGKPERFIGVIEDISLRKQAELERARLTSVLERSLNEIYIFDTKTFRFEYVNEGARRNLDYSLEEMQQLTPLDLKPEFTETDFKAIVKPLLSGKKDKHLFYTEHRRKDGTLYPVEVHLQVITHEGMPVFVAVILDITERRQLEEARSRLAAVVESSDDAIISKTLDGIITTWNQGAQRLYGYTAEETIGKSVTLLIPPHLYDEEPLIIARLKRGERIEHYETVRMKKDGSLLDVALTVSPIKDATGKIIGASKIARDITERKRAEIELRNAKNELEQRVAERTASLRETTEQLESFCYTIAHDLRSPLRAQQSFAQVLLDDYKNSLDDAGRGYAQRIINSAERLDKLVNDLLTYSRLSREDLKFQRVELEKVIADIQVHLAEEIKVKQAAVSVGPLLPVCAYEPTLNLVITNLVMNGLKFVPPGVTPQIRIWSEPNGEFIRLWIEDNGIGINPEHCHKIFGVFERLHPMDKYPGTGIGLAIVQKGVERMDGRVGVESTLGQGSRFWIELPKLD